MKAVKAISIINYVGVAVSIVLFFTVGFQFVFLATTILGLLNGTAFWTIAEFHGDTMSNQSRVSNEISELNNKLNKLDNKYSNIFKVESTLVEQISEIPNINSKKEIFKKPDLEKFKKTIQENIKNSKFDSVSEAYMQMGQALEENREYADAILTYFEALYGENTDGHITEVFSAVKGCIPKLGYTKSQINQFIDNALIKYPHIEGNRDSIVKSLIS